MLGQKQYFVLSRQEQLREKYLLIAEKPERLYNQYQNETRTIHPVLLLSANEVVLVDCGYPGFLPLLEDEMNSKGIDPGALTKVLITHHDDDHMGALFEIKEKYPEIKVVAGHGESGYISGKSKSLRLLQAEEMLNVLPKEQKPFGIQFCESLRMVKPVSVDIEVKNGEHFDWAGGCEIIDTPGHMPGHISLYLKESNSVITGDAAVIEGDQLVIANPQFTLDLDTAKASLNKLISLDADRYYCYHGGGCNADFLLVKSDCITSAVLLIPDSRIIVKRGKVILES